jgi:glycosyltransferase involved in cell wall biosynthesis
MTPARVMFVYWGRRGALTRFAHDLHAAALADETINPVISISRQSEDYARFEPFGASVMAVDTFASGHGALTAAWRIPLLRRALAERIKSDRTETVITLMPHVWTGMMISALRRGGAGYATIIHDAAPHPGDPTAAVTGWLLREVGLADRVLTLSESVRNTLITRGLAAPDRVTALFHPDLEYGEASSMLPPPSANQPLRLLFFGRMMQYKGLGLLVEALEILRAEGLAVDLGLHGEGDISGHEARLRTLGATIENRWHSDGEIASLFARYHAVALSHVEASQSGVAATAFGAGLPVVATPVGGLREQVVAGSNGLLAADVTAPAFAAAIRRMATEPSLYQSLRASLGASRNSRSMARFVRELVAAALSTDAASTSGPRGGRPL